MKKNIQICLLLLIPLVNPVASASSAPEQPGDPEKLFNRLAAAKTDTERISINDSIKSYIDGYVRSDSVMDHRFAGIRYLGQISSPDSNLKIVTWNLHLQDMPGRYYCYFIKKDEEEGPFKVFSLNAVYRTDSIRTDTVYTPSDWYGALYYDMRKTGDSDDSWMLLGIDYGNTLMTRKIIDIITFRKNDVPVFGKKVFLPRSDHPVYRAVFSYSTEAVMSLRFLNDSSVVFDHLVSFSPGNGTDREFFAPDYSYDAYIKDEGLWKLKLNIDVRNNN